MNKRVLAWVGVAGAVAVAAAIAIWVVLAQVAPEAAARPLAPGDRLRLAQTVLAIVAGAGGLLGLIVAGRRQWTTEQADRVTEQANRATEHDARERRITEIYTSAVNQLGSDQPAVQLGGIYALERLAQDNESQRETIVSVLCAFLRMDTPQPPELDSDATDEQRDRAREFRNRQAPRRAATSVLRRHLMRHVDDSWIVPPLDLAGADLTDANLIRADLTGANLTRAQLMRADLTDANLTRANLTDANLTRANLTRAQLMRADLTDANLTRARLNKARLTDADLTDANVTHANLTGALLTRADLTGADLTGADLTPADLTDANLTDADVTHANLTGALLTRANLTDVTGYTPPES